MTDKNTRIIFVLLLILFSTFCFELNIAQKEILKAINAIFVVTSILISIKHFFIRGKGFILPIQLILVSMLISFFTAYYIWDQSLFDSLKGNLPFLLWFFFFYLLYSKIPIYKIEKIIIAFGLIYIALYFFQLVTSQTVTFGWVPEYKFTRGFVRINFPGAGLFYLATFIALTKITIDKKNKPFWLSFVIVGMIITIMQVTRQYIFAVFIIYIVHIWRGKGISQKVAIIAILMIVISFFYISDSNIVKGINNENKTTLSLGENYIRVQSGTYFLTEFAPNEISQVLGSGMPYGIKSGYSNFMQQLNAKWFYLEDLGLIGIYIMYGVIAVLGYILIFIKSFTTSVPHSYYYVKYYIWFLMMTSLTSSAIYHYNFLMSTIFALYIFQYCCVAEEKAG